MPLRFPEQECDASIYLIEPGTSPIAVKEALLSFKTRETILYTMPAGGEPVSFNQPVHRPELSFEVPTQLYNTLQSGKSRVIETSIPKLEWLTGADPTLTSSVGHLLRVLWAIVASRAIQVGFPLRRTVVSVFADPTEGERKVVLRLFCNTNAVQALAFWDSLEADLQGWLATLNEYDRTTFITKVGLRVHWE